MPTLFFSVVTATHNAAAVFPNLLESLASQTCRDFEIIIQDGASTDGTLAVAESFKKRLPCLTLNSAPDKGIYDAWNKALPHAHGEWFLFLGADDALFAPDIFAKAKERIEKHSAGDGKEDLLFAAGGVVIVTSSNIPLRYISGMARGGKDRLRAGEIPVPFPGLFVRRSVFVASAFDARLRIAGDFEFLCRAWKDDRHVVRLPFLITTMRDGGVSTKPECTALCYKEILNSVEKHFHTTWTNAQRKRYRRIRFLSIVYALFPRIARDLHNAFRQFLGRPLLPDTDRARIFFSPPQCPVFIVSFNRLACLQKLVAWLEKNGFANIIIVDNNSTFPPLRSYLDALPYRVVRLKENLGHLAVWKCGLFTEMLSHEYFIVTDPDILPDDDCPEDAVMQFYNRLMAYPHITKCGFGLRIDDIPLEYPLRESVMAVEQPYWTNPLPDGSGYFAPIDTTFALYRPGVSFDLPKWFEGIRLAPPYVARHLPWYECPDATGGGGEAFFYRRSTLAQSTFWTADDADSLKRENLELRARIRDLEHQVEIFSQSLGKQLFILTYKVLRAMKNTILGKR